MSKIKLEPGTYRLKCQLTNPNPDRRQRYDWTKFPTWDQDTLIRVNRNPTPADSKPGSEMYMTAGRYSHRFYNWEAEFQMIAAHLEPVAETPSMWLAREAWENLGLDILDELHATGIVTLEQVQTALQQVLDDCRE